MKLTSSLCAASHLASRIACESLDAVSWWRRGPSARRHWARRRRHRTSPSSTTRQTTERLLLQTHRRHHQPPLPLSSARIRRTPWCKSVASTFRGASSWRAWRPCTTAFRVPSPRSTYSPSTCPHLSSTIWSKKTFFLVILSLLNKAFL